jgi:probable phosphoglycerate mutase
MHDAVETWKPTPRRRLYLMRHGEVDYFDGAGRPFRPATVPLNAEGRRQAEAAARALATVPLDLALTSGLRRTVETAELALAGRAVPVQVEPRMREIETGRLSEWAAATPEQIERVVLGALASDLTPESTFLAGESFGSLQARLTACWAEILARRDWRHLLIVAHGVVNRMLLTRLVGSGLGGIGALEQDAGCINLVEVDDAGRCLVRLANYSPANPLKQGMELTTVEGLYQQFLRGRGPRPGVTP